MESSFDIAHRLGVCADILARGTEVTPLPPEPELTCLEDISLGIAPGSLELAAQPGEYDVIPY